MKKHCPSAFTFFPLLICKQTDNLGKQKNDITAIYFHGFFNCKPPNSGTKSYLSNITQISKIKYWLQQTCTSEIVLNFVLVGVFTMSRKRLAHPVPEIVLST